MQVRSNPSVCSQSSQPPSLSGKIYQTCGRLNFANLLNFYMLPARELASPQAMTEGCALRYINCLSNLSCLPLGEGAEHSEAEGGCASQLIYRVATKNFPANRLLSYMFDAKYEEAICGR